jgi:hypothetical protein
MDTLEGSSASIASPRKRPFHPPSRTYLSTPTTSYTSTGETIATLVDRVKSLYQTRAAAAACDFKTWTDNLADESMPSVSALHNKTLNTFLDFTVPYPLPSLVDPYQWNFVVNNIESENRGSEAHFKEDKPLNPQEDGKPLRDAWHVYELFGDKYFSQLMMRLLVDCHIPHNIATTLMHALCSNSFQSRVSIGVGLTEFMKSIVGNKGPASALEVSPILKPLQQIVLILGLFCLSD